MDLTIWYPSTVTADRGRQFQSSLWKHLMTLLGSSRLRIPLPTTQLPTTSLNDFTAQSYIQGISSAQQLD
jgi:hypothetical protein